MPAFGLSLAPAYVTIVSLTGLIWSLQTLTIRLFIRLRIHGPLGWDDLFCGLATLFACANSTLNIIQCFSFGLGRDVDTLSSQVVEKQRLFAWTVNQIYLVALCLSMLSVCFLLARVTQRTAQVRLAYAIAASTVVWCLISWMVYAFECDLPGPWMSSPRSRCTNIYHVWLGITISKTVLELANAVAAAKLLWHVRISWTSKLAVLAAFTVRLLVIPPSYTRLHYLHMTLHATNWSYSRIRVAIITQVVLHVSIILATVPCAKPWLVAFETGGLQAPAEEVRKASASPRVSTPLLPVAKVRSRPGTPMPLGPLPNVTHSSAIKSSADDELCEPTAAGHHKRVEAWPVRTYKTKATYEVRAEHVGPSKSRRALLAARKISNGSNASSHGITRTKSFSVDIDEINDYFSAKERQRISDAPSSMEQAWATAETKASLRMEDAGGLLEARAGKRRPAEDV